MTSTYIATIRGRDLAQAPQIEITGTLAQAKRAAFTRFIGGFAHHEMVIYRRLENFAHDGILVARRRMDDDRWTAA